MGTHRFHWMGVSEISIIAGTDFAVVNLTRNYVAIIDSIDAPYVSKYVWQAIVSPWQVRAGVMLYRSMTYLHHFILLKRGVGIPSGTEVDHIDGNPLNNSFSNLRVVSHTENMRNTNRHRNRVGYSFNKRANLWSVYIDNPGQKRKYLGYTKTEAEAKQRIEKARSQCQ